MRLFLLVSVLLCISNVNAQIIQSAMAEVRDVTVFTSGAEVNNVVKIDFPKGNVKFVIQNVARDLDVQSVQLAGPDGLTVLSIAPEYSNDVDIISPEHKKLNDSLHLATLARELIINKENASLGALKILNNEQLLGGAVGKFDLADLSKIVDYYQLKAVDLNTTIAQLRRDKLALDSRIKFLREQIKYYGGEGGQLVVQFLATKAVKGELRMSYLTFSASWQAYYDLRAKSISDPLAIFYKARLRQHTGVNWKGVNLVLSTGNPSLSNAAPILSPNYVTFQHSAFIADATYNSSARQNAIQSLGKRSESELDEVVATRGLEKLEAPVTSVRENQLSATFDIEVPYDVLSNGEPHAITLKEYHHPAMYKYYAVPKIDKDVFLLAEITEFGQLNLVPGDANIIFENMFVGQSHINPSVTTDTLNLSLGRDRAISVKRERILDQKSKQISGGTQREQYTYELRIRNNKSVPINLLLKDQFPVSTDKTILIDLIDSGGAVAHMETGILTWMLSVKPGETQTFRFTFHVKHPKDRAVFF